MARPQEPAATAVAPPEVPPARPLPALHPAVLLLALLVSSPALWDALVTGSLPLQDALLRLVVAWGAAAIGVSVVVSLVGPTATENPDHQASAQASTPRNSPT